MIFLGIGSSEKNAEKIFVSAEQFLENQKIKIIKKSKNLKNPPQGGVAKNEFTNAVWEISVSKNMKPELLLEILKSCEIFHGRDLSAERWADRSLDLDILVFGDQVIQSKNLTIPHPEIKNRTFVIRPWLEIVAEDFEIPGLGKLSSLLGGNFCQK